MRFHTWQKNTGLESETLAIDFSNIDALLQGWLDLKRRRERSDPHAYKAFLEQIYRLWAIETGVIEGIYDISPGTTRTLVERGLSVDYIDPSATDKSPRDVIEVLKDHRDAAEFVTESIRRKIPITNFRIAELHKLLLRNQKFYVAVDQFDNEIEKVLHHGEFKLEPNSPTRPDGEIHEYCPPIQVQSEMDSLVAHYDAYLENKTRFHPIAVAAWLHHRFTQIHPFEDGNGRVARALLTWHLARDEYLPVVISRDRKDEYIKALEIADSGNLNTFVNFIVGLERQIISKALEEESTEPTPQVFTRVLENVARMAGQRVESEQTALRSVNFVASGLRDQAVNYLADRSHEIQTQLTAAGLAIKCVTESGGPDNEKGHWYRYQITETAKTLGYWVNFNEDRYLVRLCINPDDGSTVPRMVFVISLHHVGRQLTGTMAANAFVQIDRETANESDQADGPVGTDLKTCSPASFAFRSNSDQTVISDTFGQWIEEALSAALSYWGQYLS